MSEIEQKSERCLKVWLTKLRESKPLEWIDTIKALPNEDDLVEVKGKYKDQNKQESMVMGRMLYKDKRFFDMENNLDWTDKIQYWRYGIQMDYE